MSPAPLSRRTSREHGVGATRTLLVPVGSCEQHGPHLPLSTDSVIAEALCAMVATRRDVDVAPTLGYSASGEHAGFPGLLSLGTEVTASVLVELIRSARASWRRVVIVSAHGGNVDALRRVAEVARRDGDAVVIWMASEPDGDAHAGLSETSIMLHIDPALVRATALEPGDDLDSHWMTRAREGGIAAVSANGVLGDPRGATSQLGSSIMERWCAEVVAMIDEAWSQQ